MPREFSRSQRVASQMQRELAGILQSELKDPRLGFITVNAVELTRDLSLAKIYFTILGKAPGQIEKERAILEHSIPFIRRELAKRMRLRVLPELRFVYDESLEKGMRIDRLLQDLARETDDPAEDPE
ncbi:MAG: 30S ribosome-binding factor RbfA [Gammaproteobacteria bacterium]